MLWMRLMPSALMAAISRAMPDGYHRRGHVAANVASKVVVMTDDNGAVRVAEDNLSSHIYQLVHKEQTAFEHFLMNEYTAFCPGGNHQQHTEQVCVSSGQVCRQWS